MYLCGIFSTTENIIVMYKILKHSNLFHQKRPK